VKNKTADIHVEAEVRNETASDYASITLSAVVVDADGVVRAKFDGNTSDLVSGQTKCSTPTGRSQRALLGRERSLPLRRLFHPHRERQVVDVCKTRPASARRSSRAARAPAACGSTTISCG
jgi:hypothetical protein